VLAWHGCPPEAEPAAPDQRTRLAHFADVMWPGGQPEDPLGPDDARPAFVEEGLEAGRMEGVSRPVDKGADAIFLGFRHMVLETVKLLEPQRMLARLLEIETACAENVSQFDAAEVGFDDLCRGIEATDDLAGGNEVFDGRHARLVEHDNIGELDLLDQQFHQRTRIAVTGRRAALGQKILRAIVLQKVHGVDHRHHRVEPGNVGQAPAGLVAEIEGRGDG